MKFPTPFQAPCVVVSIPLKLTALMVDEFCVGGGLEFPEPLVPDEIEVPPVPQKTPLITALAPAEAVTLIFTFPEMYQIRQTPFEKFDNTCELTTLFVAGSTI